MLSLLPQPMVQHACGIMAETNSEALVYAYVCAGVYLCSSACVCVLPTCMSLHHCHAVTWRPEGVGTPGAGVICGCELPNVVGCWELNPGPLQGQPVLLTHEASL